MMPKSGKIPREIACLRQGSSGLNVCMKTVPLRTAGLELMVSGIVRNALLTVAALALWLVPIKARAAAGDLYVSEPVEGIISKFAPDGTKSTFASGLDHPGGLVFDRVGNLFVSVGQDITRITLSGEMTVFATGLSLPSGLAFDGAGNLYVAYSTGDTGGIWKFNPDGAKSPFGSVPRPRIGQPIRPGF